MSTSDDRMGPALACGLTLALIAVAGLLLAVGWLAVRAILT